MNGFTVFLGDPKVHDTVIITMVISSFFAAIRRFKAIDNAPIVTSFTAFIKLIWNFFYDWGTGFWSMKTGQPIHPLELHTESSVQTTEGPETKQSTLATEQNPTLPETPAKP